LGLGEVKDSMEARSVYLICQEEFLSALSYGPVRSTLHPPPPRAPAPALAHAAAHHRSKDPKKEPRRRWNILSCLGEVRNLFMLYQKHFPYEAAGTKIAAAATTTAAHHVREILTKLSGGGRP